MIYVRRATLADAEYLATRLREADQAEVRALTGQTPFEALTDGLECSDIPLVISDDNDRPLAMFGAAPMSGAPEVGIIWMLAVDDLAKHARQFLSVCRQWINAFHVRYPILWNVVDERNALSIRWLRWAGFTFAEQPTHLGLEQRPFYEFYKTRRVSDQTSDRAGHPPSH